MNTSARAVRKHTFGVYIGRFQPLHSAHLAVMLESLTRVDKLIVVLGSARSARSVKNPFTVEERQELILQSLLAAGANRNKILFGTVRDYFYNENLWLAEIQSAVNALTRGNEDIALIGHLKDDSSYYLRSFPEWEYRPTEIVSPLNATEIRTLYFAEKDISQGSVPGVVHTFLQKFRSSVHYKDLKAEFDYLLEYKKQWAGAPYPPVFVTTDAVVVRSGHVLLIRRGGNPGRGKLAMPGGFLEQSETLLESCLRELREETGIGLSKELLEDAVKGSHVFDYPGRSQRGRTVTHAFYFDLGLGQLPRVNGSDDAAEALWMPLSDVLAHPEWFFEDHYSIVEHFLLRK